MNPNQPLWMPRGSVRAILALIIVAPFAYLALKSGVQLTGDQVVGIMGIALTAYFVEKAGRS